MSNLKPLKRIEDYNKTLPVLEVYTAVQSEGSRQGYPTIVIRTTGCTHRCYFFKVGGVIVGILLFTQKKVHSTLMILLKCTMKTLIFQK